MENEEKKERIQWQPIIEMIIVLMTILGSTIPLYIHTDSKLEHALEGIRDEMREFHTQLALQDKEFKMRLCDIEEKIKK